MKVLKFFKENNETDFAILELDDKNYFELIKKDLNCSSIEHISLGGGFYLYYSVPNEEIVLALYDKQNNFKDIVYGDCFIVKIDHTISEELSLSDDDIKLIKEKYLTFIRLNIKNLNRKEDIIALTIPFESPNYFFNLY